MKDEPVHEHEHLTPTVIHHPEEDMTILARWLHRGMEQGVRFWLLVGGVMVAITALAVISSGLAAGKSANTQAWIELIPAKTPEDQLKVADAFPKTPVADWAKLRAASEEYDSGLIDLTTPGKKETAGPRLKRALDLFQQVVAEAPKDSSQSIGAALGVARTLEARNELAEAIKQYKFVASNWPGTPEARQAESLVKALDDPENAQFYKELYAYTPPASGGASPLIPPPGTSGGIDFKSMIPDLPAPPGLDAPPPTPTPATVTPAPGTPTVPSVKADETKPADAPKADLPADPFASPTPK